MERTIQKKIEVAANIAIIVVAVILITVVTRQYLLPSRGRDQVQRAGAPKGPQRGDAVKLPGVDWLRNGKTILIAVSTNCRFCTQSAPFYQRLVNEHDDAQLIALVPQTGEEGQAYLEKLGVKIGDVRQISYDSIGVSATPTLILVDSSGKVANAWVGALPPDKENEVVRMLRP